jgi:hypothetical protein
MRGKLVIKITMGEPSKENFEEILNMIFKGYNEGMDMPKGIYWSVETTGGMYDNLQSILEDEDLE